MFVRVLGTVHTAISCACHHKQLLIYIESLSLSHTENTTSVTWHSPSILQRKTSHHHLILYYERSFRLTSYKHRICISFHNVQMIDCTGTLPRSPWKITIHFPGACSWQRIFNELASYSIGAITKSAIGNKLPCTQTDESMQNALTTTWFLSYRNLSLVNLSAKI